MFEPNLRHNQARKLASTRTFTPFAKVIALKPDDFMAKSQPLYPQVRSMFEYFADTGKLRRWYERYTATFAEDSTGKRALEDVFGKPLAQIENDWRTWVLKRPAVDTAPKGGVRTIGVEVTGATDGVRVRTVERRSAAARAGLKAGDVITGIGDTPVRSPREFDAAVAAAGAGQTAIIVRRGTERMTLSIEFPGANPRARARVENTVVLLAAKGPAFSSSFFHRATLNPKVEAP